MWVLNIWLFMTFFFAPDVYRAEVAAGSPCFAYVASLADPAFPQDSSVQPTCWYDATNVNPGVAGR